jgi:hypothetical protein
MGGIQYNILSVKHRKGPVEYLFREIRYIGSNQYHTPAFVAKGVGYGNLHTPAQISGRLGGYHNARPDPFSYFCRNCIRETELQFHLALKDQTPGSFQQIFCHPTLEISCANRTQGGNEPGFRLARDRVATKNDQPLLAAGTIGFQL